MGTNFAPLLADLFFIFYESQYLDNLIRSDHSKLTRSFTLSNGYMQLVSKKCTLF